MKQGEWLTGNFDTDLLPQRELCFSSSGLEGIVVRGNWLRGKCGDQLDVPTEQVADYLL